MVKTSTFRFVFAAGLELCDAAVRHGRYGEYVATALQELHANYAVMWPAAVRVFCSVRWFRRHVCKSAERD